jgi:fibronectin-binding autotransporter adhesin
VTSRRSLFCRACLGLAITLLATSLSNAAVTTTGQVQPTDPNLWTSTTSAYVGDSANGILSVDAGSAIAVRHFFVASDSGVIGEAVFEGNSTALSTSSSIEVGRYGSGWLVVRDGASVTNGLDLSIGLIRTSRGTVTVSGAATVWSTARRALVGHYGQGFLNVLEGATFSSELAEIGFGNDSRGEVIVQGQGSSWNSGNLSVGGGGVGVLNIIDGASASSAAVRIGDAAAAEGYAGLAGVGSTWSTTGALHVGYFGEASLSIHSGATVQNASHAYVGYQLGSSGLMTVTGPGSKWQVDGGLNVGVAGIGTLQIRDGAEVISRESATLGLAESGIGTVSLFGVGSRWVNEGSLSVGYGGNGYLSIGNDAVVKTQGLSVLGFQVARGGGVTVSGAGAKWTTDGDLFVGLSGVGTLTVAEGGVVDVAREGAHRQFTLAYDDLSRGVVNLEAGGALRLNNRMLTSGSGAATFNFNGGRLEGVGTYSVGAGLTQNGGVLAPGSSAGVTTIQGFYDLKAGALEIELLSGAAAGVGFDRLVVNGGVTLREESRLDLLLGYAASVGDSFLIVDSKNSAPINGTFANDDELTAEFESLRYSFSLSYASGTGNDIAATVASVSLIGDYNADGFVDAADYTVWQDAVGTSVAAYAGADGNGDGVVDEGDHAVWAAHYGASLEAARAQAVPEPAGVVLAVLALVAGGRRRLGSGRSAS